MNRELYELERRKEELKSRPGDWEAVEYAEMVHELQSQVARLDEAIAQVEVQLEKQKILQFNCAKSRPLDRNRLLKQVYSKVGVFHAIRADLRRRGPGPA